MSTENEEWRENSFNKENTGAGRDGNRSYNREGGERPYRPSYNREGGDRPYRPRFNANNGESSSIIKSSCSKVSGFKKSDLSDEGKWLYSMLRKKAGLTK